MNSNQNILAMVAIVIAIIALLFTVVLSNKSAPTAGGVTNYDEVDATAIKIGGTNGSRIGPIISSTACNFLGMDASHAATSTKPYDCAVTGIVSGDTVIALFSTTTVNAGLTNVFWSIRSCHASTTSGFVTCEVFNGTGGAATPSANAVGSSTNILVTHPLTSVPGL